MYFIVIIYTYKTYLFMQVYKKYKKGVAKKFKFKKGVRLETLNIGIDDVGDVGGGMPWTGVQGRPLM